MPLNRKLVRVGAAKQTAKGAGAASPTYGFGITDGSVFDPDMNDEPRQITGATRFNESAVRESVEMGISFETFAMPKILGILTKGAVGAVVTTGAGPYTHTITPATTLDWLTLFGRYDTQYIKMIDSQLDQLTLSWERDGDLKLGVEAIATQFEWLPSAWTAATDEDTTGGVMSARGGTFTFDGAAAKINSGEITYNNQLERRELADQVIADDLTPGDIEAQVSLTLVPDDILLFRKALTGSAGGTTVAGTPYYGSFDFKWIIDANTFMQVASTRLMFMAEFPDADTSGGPAEVEIEGLILKPSSGAEATYTLKNNVATY